MSSHHHTHCPSCNKVLRVKYGMAEKCPCSAPPTPVCSTCNDTHRMELDDRTVPCTSCPTPCPKCAGNGGRGAYCETTPCGCECHVKTQTSTLEIDRVRAENERLRDENAHLVQRAAELEVYRQLVKQMAPDMNRALAYGQRDGTAFRIGNNHLRNAMDEIERLNRELAAARQPGVFEATLRASIENYLSSLKKG